MKLSLPVAGIAVIGLAAACRTEQPPQPPTLTYQAISFGGVAERSATQRFTAVSGIQVVHAPVPESVSERLAFTQRLLEARSATPDVLLIDVTWPDVLAEHLMDLRPPRGAGARQYFPALADHDTLEGRFVTVPAYMDMGLLYYRSDLLAKYGYRAPPTTWDALEQVAARVQAGERAAGNARFWGFVWQGAASESLTCNALEWQASQGGGRIVEPDGKVTVNNPAAAAAFTRAARWVGTISPPDVLRFQEEDAREVWQSGNAAFMRNWAYAYLPGQAAESPLKDNFDVARLPGGATGSTSTLGGWHLAVSRYTRHPEAALRFARFMSGPEAQRIRLLEGWNIPTLDELYANGGVMREPRYKRLAELVSGPVVARPARQARHEYGKLSLAYARAVHAILTGETSAKPALAALEEELQGLLASPERGTSSGPPR